MAAKKKFSNFDLFHHPVPCNFGIDNEFVSNAMRDFSNIPLFMIKHFVIAFDPNGSKSNSPKKMPKL